MTKLHPIQEKLLDLLANQSLDGMSLREIGTEIGVEHPQKVSHHLEQLEKKGYLRRDPSSGQISFLKKPIEDIVYFPLYGMAQCGPKGLLAEENQIDQVPLPTKIFGISNPDSLFLVRARGNSMEPKIKDGDLVLAKKQDHESVGSICIVVHNQMPKLKEVMKVDRKTVVLKSENEDYEAEILKEDEDEIQIVGVVKNVISNF